MERKHVVVASYFPQKGLQEDTEHFSGLLLHTIANQRRSEGHTVSNVPYVD